MKKTNRWTCTLCHQETGMLWAMLVFLVLAYFVPALWSMYRMAAGAMPAVLLPVAAVVLCFMAWVARPICRELARRPWRPLFGRSDRDE